MKSFFSGVVARTGLWRGGGDTFPEIDKDAVLKEIDDDVLVLDMVNGSMTSAQSSAYIRLQNNIIKVGREDSTLARELRGRHLTERLRDASLAVVKPSVGNIEDTLRSPEQVQKYHVYLINKQFSALDEMFGQYNRQIELIKECFDRPEECNNMTLLQGILSVIMRNIFDTMDDVEKKVDEYELSCEFERQMKHYRGEVEDVERDLENIQEYEQMKKDAEYESSKAEHEKLKVLYDRYVVGDG